MDRVVFLVVVTVSSVSRSVIPVGDIPACLSVAGSIGFVGGEGVSEIVMAVDRVMLMESWSIEDVASPRGDSFTSVDWGLEEVMDKIEVGFGDTMIVR